MSASSTIRCLCCSLSTWQRSTCRTKSVGCRYSGRSTISNALRNRSAARAAGRWVRSRTAWPGRWRRPEIGLIDALDRWDLEAVDPAILDFARLATPEQLSELLFRYSTRDLREIGHKAIAVQNVHRLLPIVGPEYAPPVLRSLAAALQNHGNDPNPATRDLPSDRTWREFRAMLGEIPKTWKQGRRDDAARNELVRTLREVSELDAGLAVIDHLKHGVSPTRYGRVSSPPPRSWC